MGGYKNCSDLFSCLVFAYIDSFEFKRTLLNFIKKLIKLRKGTDTYFFLSIKSSWNLNDTKKKKRTFSHYFPQVTLCLIFNKYSAFSCTDLNWENFDKAWIIKGSDIFIYGWDQRKQQPINTSSSQLKSTHQKHKYNVPNLPDYKLHHLKV